VVHSIIYDDKTQKAKGVRVIDTNTKETIEYFSKIIFLNAATLNSTLILMNSKSARFPNGLGNDSGELGHNLMDHNYNARVEGTLNGFEDKFLFGKRPTGTYLARFRNFGSDEQENFSRGYAYSVMGSRVPGTEVGETEIGQELKNDLTSLGPWKVQMTGMGECLPYHENKVSLNKTEKDAWDMPLLEVDAEYKANEFNMQKDMVDSAIEMLEKANFTDIEIIPMNRNFGLNIHEMGTARMGKSPKTSVLNKFNQVWGCENVFVTDGSCMTSSACQNPSLTYMAITARAADHAVKQLKRQNL
jgi:choline dehydrogenase-like flavoprotein